jgi:hypothetical protein
MTIRSQRDRGIFVGRRAVGLRADIYLSADDRGVRRLDTFVGMGFSNFIALAIIAMGAAANPEQNFGNAVMSAFGPYIFGRRK